MNQLVAGGAPHARQQGRSDNDFKLDGYKPASIANLMSVLEIKQGLSRLTARERREVQIYLHQLRRTTTAWKNSTARKIEDVRAGKFTTLKELETRHRRG